jgi:phosphoribosylanthranilate isomerase
MVRVKICGITTMDDALAAVHCGADALGFVFAEGSPRRVEPDRAKAIIGALPPFVQCVGVFVDTPADTIAQIQDHCGLDLVQLHHEESAEMISHWGRRAIKAVQVQGPSPEQEKAFLPATLLLDSYHPHKHGGTGRTFDWSLVQELARQRPVILAGGLTAENVAEAVRMVRPYAVDVSSGVERSPGRKDPDKMAAFVQSVKGAPAGNK